MCVRHVMESAAICAFKVYRGAHTSEEWRQSRSYLPTIRQVGQILDAAGGLQAHHRDAATIFGLRIIVDIMISGPLLDRARPVPEEQYEQWKSALSLERRAFGTARASPFDEVLEFVLAEYTTAAELWDPRLASYTRNAGGRAEFERGDEYHPQRNFSETEIQRWWSRIVGRGPGVGRNPPTLAGTCDWSRVPVTCFDYILNLERLEGVLQCAQCAALSSVLRSCGGCKQSATSLANVS
ncbi:hypothetical protein EXIGLDRAFT_152215 [Exidia glandulosa HHB12029]|uniref:Uncharacterized protein n=1 Tax=Exidia glandulosa HHB12029 TaxID=1314781 RepID=A0A165QEU7_EXIGL|nr:hypothetical protein EXIGLDRAFT_152215 [Exidia glandulosa HHB12029]